MQSFNLSAEITNYLVFFRFIACLCRSKYRQYKCLPYECHEHLFLATLWPNGSGGLSVEDISSKPWKFHNQILDLKAACFRKYPRYGVTVNLHTGSIVSRLSIWMRLQIFKWYETDFRFSILCLSFLFLSLKLLLESWLIKIATRLGRFYALNFY